MKYNVAINFFNGSKTVVEAKGFTIVDNGKVLKVDLTDGCTVYFIAANVFNFQTSEVKEETKDANNDIQPK